MNIKILILAFVVILTGGCVTSPQSSDIHYSRWADDKYDFYIKMPGDVPVMAAVIRTPEAYDETYKSVSFGLLMPGDEPLDMDKENEPAPSFYADNMLLNITESTLAPKDFDSLYHVEKLVQQAGVLELHYTFTPDNDYAAFGVNAPLTLSLPNKTYQRLKVYRNGKMIADVALENGEGRFAIDER